MNPENEGKPTLVRSVHRVYHKGKKADEFVKEHAHPALEVIYVIYGNVYLDVSGEKIVLNPGDCGIVPPWEKHTFRGEPGFPYDYLNIMFHGDVPKTLFHTPLHPSRRTRDMIEALQQESVYVLPYYEQLVRACLTQLLIDYIRHRENAIPMRLPEPATRHLYRSDLVKKALHVIRQEYATDLNLEKLGQATGCGKAYLRNLLKKETGETFSEILQKHRVSAAKHLLRVSSRSLEEIASAVGYNSMPFFFKIFKRWTGMTPMDYARSLEKSEERPESDGVNGSPDLRDPAFV